MAENPKEDLLHLIKRVGAFLTVKISNLLRRLVCFLNFYLFLVFLFVELSPIFMHFPYVFSAVYRVLGFSYLRGI